LLHDCTVYCKVCSLSTVTTKRIRRKNAAAVPAGQCRPPALSLPARCRSGPEKKYVRPYVQNYRQRWNGTVRRVELARAKACARCCAHVQSRCAQIHAACDALDCLRAVTRDVQEQEQTIHARTATAHSRIRLHGCIYLEEFASRRNGVVLAFFTANGCLVCAAKIFRYHVGYFKRCWKGCSNTDKKTNYITCLKIARRIY
jgi:hypothetical protein